MTPTQRNIGVLGVAVALFLLVYPPWKLEYERGYSRITYGYLFDPPTEKGDGSGGTIENRLQSQSVAVWMLLGQLTVVAGLVAFLLWLYRPAGHTATPDPGPARPAPA